MYLRLSSVSFIGLVIGCLMMIGGARASPTGQNVVIGYYYLAPDQINRYTESDPTVVPFPISRITPAQASQLTHINFSFLDINVNGECAWDSAIDLAKALSVTTRLGDLRQHNPNLRIMFVVGGWEYSKDDGKSVNNYRNSVATSESRGRFASSCVNLMKRFGFDGIDIDWEYPRPEDAANFGEALKEVRRLLMTESVDRASKPYQLTIAGSGGASYLARYYDHLTAIAAQVDYINLMTYDLAGAWDTLTNHHSPLLGDPAGPVSSNALRGSKQSLNAANAIAAFPSPFSLTVDAAVKQYLLAGVPASKLVVGVPFYGRAFKGVGATDNGQYSPHTTSGEEPYEGNPSWLVGCTPCIAANEPRAVSYADIQGLLTGRHGYERHFNQLTRTPYLFHREKLLFVTYDDEESLMYKAKYIRRENLAGVMFWHLGQDDAKGSLLNALHHYLNDLDYDDARVDLGTGVAYPAIRPVPPAPTFQTEK